jgi:hypothetical protein
MSTKKRTPIKAKRPVQIDQSSSKKSADTKTPEPDSNQIEAIAHGPTPKVPVPIQKQSIRKPKAVENKVSAPKVSERTGVKIFQIYTESWQKDLLDPAFVGLDQSRPSSEIAELGLPALLTEHSATQTCEWWGLTSWRFTQLSGLTGQDLQRSISQLPNHDVYLIQYQSNNEGLYHNGWMQYEIEHPGLIELAQKLFPQAGINPLNLINIQKSTEFFADGVIVGNSNFWKIYNDLAKKLVSASKSLGGDAQKQLYEVRQDEKSLLGRTSRLGLLIQASVPLMIKTSATPLKAHKIHMESRDRDQNVHQQLLKEMKDVAHRTQSSWLAACWINYRNLYLNQTQGKAWSQKHLRHITPTEIRFD